MQTLLLVSRTDQREKKIVERSSRTKRMCQKYKNRMEPRGRDSKTEW